MKWPWQKTPDRARLRIFADGRAILALPAGSTERDADESGRALRDWMSADDQPLLVLHFPVDIEDFRPQTSAKSIGFGKP